MQRLLIIAGVTFLAAALFSLFLWHETHIGPKTFSYPSTYPNCLYDSGDRILFDAHEALVISNWISVHQTGWRHGSSDDFNPNRTQLMCDSYVIEINTDSIVFQYYENEFDLTNDPSDSFVVIKRSLSADERAFWKKQVADIKAPNSVLVELK